jgi:DNA invertase Pin-like site-specific DNA recombinase
MTPQPLVAYYRVSTRRQKISGLGLEGQKIAVRRYLEACPGELIAELTDIDSGRKNDRAKFEEALWLCRVYGAKLIVAHLDRMSRSVALIAGLMDSGVDFVAVNMPYANRFTVHIFAAAAEYEAQLASERTKAAFAARRARGLKLGSPHHPNRDQFLAIISKAKVRAAREKARTQALELAPLLCALRDQGATINGIADQLTRMGIPTPRNGKRWGGHLVRAMFERAGERKPKFRRRPNPGWRDQRLASQVPLFLGSMNGLHL